MNTSFKEWYIGYMGEEGRQQIDFLDSIDLLPFFKNCGKGVKLRDIIRDIEDMYDYGPFKDKIPPELEGYFFCNMCEEEFADYLKERYPDKFDIRYRTIYDEWYEISEKV